MKRLMTIMAASALLFPLLAAAHSTLRQTTPANGSVLKTAPEQIMLKFSKSATLTKLTILRAGDKEAQKLGPLPKAPAEQFLIAAPKLGPGAYTVDYRAVSYDKHVVAGALKFTVAVDSKAK